MKWLELIDVSQLHQIINQTKELSYQNKAVLLFKHSTRCSISSMALNRIENKWQNNDAIDTYYLDLLNHRDISNEIENILHVEHASPQVLLIKNGVCVYNASHSEINVADILQSLS